MDESSTQNQEDRKCQTGDYNKQAQTVARNKLFITIAKYCLCGGVIFGIACFGMILIDQHKYDSIIGFCVLLFFTLGAMLIIFAPISATIGYGISFFQKSSEKLSLASKISALLGVILFFADAILFRSRQISSCALLLVFAIAPLFGIVRRIILLRNKKLERVGSPVLEIIFLSIPVIILSLFLSSFVLSRLYTPPALTSMNVPVYERCIQYMKNHNEYRAIFAGLWVTENNTYCMSFYTPEISKEEFLKMKEISEDVYKAGCSKVDRQDDMLLFFKRTNIFMPSSPGVLYSLRGANPNEVRSEILDKHKPFVKIKGNWYISRSLAVATIRMAPRYIPKSLFDHSLDTKNITFSDDLDKQIILRKEQQ